MLNFARRGPKYRNLCRYPMAPIFQEMKKAQTDKVSGSILVKLISTAVKDQHQQYQSEDLFNCNFSGGILLGGFGPLISAN